MAARDTATRRGSRAVQTEDIAFLLRHDATRLARIRAFLAWKDWTKRGLDFDQEEGDLLEELCNQHMASPRVPANWSWSAVEAAGEGAREDDERFIDRDHLAAFAGSVERLRVRFAVCPDLDRVAEQHRASKSWSRSCLRPSISSTPTVSRPRSRIRGVRCPVCFFSRLLTQYAQPRNSASSSGAASRSALCCSSRLTPAQDRHISRCDHDGRRRRRPRLHRARDSPATLRDRSRRATSTWQETLVNIVYSLQSQ